MNRIRKTKMNFIYEIYVCALGTELHLLHHCKLIRWRPTSIQYEYIGTNGEFREKKADFLECN